MMAVHLKHQALAREPMDANDLHELLCQQLQRLSTVLEEENLDETYPPFSAGMSDAQRAQRKESYQRYLSEHRCELFEVYRLWGDEPSRDLFVHLMLFRALGHHHVKLPSNTPSFWRAQRTVASLQSTQSALSQVAGSTELRHFCLQRQGIPVELDCLPANVLFSFFLHQYYLDRTDLRIGPRPGDWVIDAGACFGDTAVEFSLKAGSDGRVHCFEVVDSHLRVLHYNAAQNAEGAQITVHERGLSDVDREGVIASSPVQPGFSISDDIRLPLSRLDTLVQQGLIERVDFIKMDIEGHEEAALRGAVTVLQRFRPRLAISIYHRWEDYHRLPLLIRDLNLGYRFFLDNYTISDGETVMYCVA